MTFSNCADTTIPVYYIGAPGQLQEIRMPNISYPRTPDDNSIIHVLLDGQVADRSVNETRIWDVSFNHMSYAERNIIEAIRTYATGYQPTVFIDPHTVNFFTPSIASGTDVGLTTAGFSVTGTGETIESSSAAAYFGSHSLAWNLSPVVTGSGGGVLCMSTSYAPSGWATPDSQAWSMAGQLLGGGSDPIVTIVPQLVWLDSTGTPISTTAGTPVDTSGGSWTSFLVSGTAPANAVYVHPRLVVSPGSVGGSTIVYVDSLILDMRETPRDWVVGEGQPRICIVMKKYNVPLIGRTDLSYSFVELTV